MNKRWHPEHQIEAQRLGSTLIAMQNSIEAMHSSTVKGGDRWATRQLQERRQERIKQLEGMLDEPYFGRIDFTPQDHPAETYYLGKQPASSEGIEIIDWRAPVGQLFYNGTGEQQQYQTPAGTIHGCLLLKRHLIIEQRQLHHLQDDVDRREQSLDTTQNRDFLLASLEQRETNQLQDIIRTIQVEQDQIIRAAHDQPILVNGVAGSGKTSIAYHRLSYLLYPNANRDITANNCIIFGPNRLFFSYARQILPTLGIEDIQQTTFESWALEQMGWRGQNRKRQYRVTDSALRLFLDPKSSRRERRQRWKQAQLKGSLDKMLPLLQAFVRYWRRQFTVPDEGLQYKEIGRQQVNVALDAVSLSAIHQHSLDKNLTLTKQRDFVLNQIVRLATEQYDAVTQVDSPRQRDLFAATERQQALVQLRRRIHADLERVWPSLNLPTDYFHLLTTPQLLKTIGKGIVTAADIKLLIATAVPKGHVVDVEDIPALFYLHLHRNGRTAIRYDHMVIDEAQDLSPLQFKLLQYHSKEDGMTILGDMAQGIHAYRGLTDWRQLDAVFGTTLRYEQVLNNYRSTQEMVSFANALLAKIQPQAMPSIPFARTGPHPHIEQVASWRQMLHHAAETINQLQSQSVSNIVLITKNKEQATQVATYLRQQGVDVNDNVHEEYRGGVVVLPVALTKGMEFDAVLLLNASQRMYDDRILYDGRLLYIAVTRTLHHLHIYTIGRLSSYLQPIDHPAR